MRRADSPIDRLYAVFQPYRLPPKIDKCSHCELDDHEEKFRAKPLREMTWDDFGPYPGKAMMTFGASRDFRHFLPRMVELWIAEPLALYDADTLVRLLDYAGWLDWPASERDALHAALEEWCAELSKTRVSDPIDQSDLDRIRGELESALRRAADAV